MSALTLGGQWSTYWFNGRIYGSEIARGLDVLELTVSEHLTENELAAARLVQVPEENPQAQRRSLTAAERVTGARRKSALEGVAARAERLARGASGKDLERLQGIATTLRSVAAK